MALPLKTGADLYNQQLIRARLQNLGAQPNTADVGLGQVYFNTGTNTAASLRIGYCYETGSVPKFHHVANLEDVNRLEELISALSGSSSESVASVLGRVITLEGYFSNGKAKDADLLDGHNSDYFAEAATLNDLLEDYESFKAVFSDNSDDYINTWAEVKAFLDGIKNTEDLNAILLGINTELGKKADKATTLAGYGIIDAVLKQDYINLNDLATVHAQVMGYGNPDGGWKTYSSGILSKVHDSGFALQGGVNALFFRGIGGSVWEDKWHVILHDGNYASELDTRYLQLTGGIISNTSNAPLKIKTDSESAWVGIEYLNNLGEREGSIGVYGGKPIFVPAALDKIWTILHSGNYSDLITTLNNNLTVPSITIGGIKLSVVEGQLQIEGDAYATGQLSSGGIGSEGSGSGASGIVILEDWEKYDDTLAQVLGAGLGVGLRDKIAALESKATKVSVSGLLESGKSIGTIKVDDTSYNLLAPDDYLPLSGGVIKGSLEKRLPTENATQNYILFTRHNGTAQGYLGFNGVDNPIYIPSAANAIYSLLHEGNYESIVGNKFLKLTGGTVNGLVTVKRDAAVPFYVINEGNFQSSWVALRFGIGSTYKSSIGASTSKNGLVRLNSDLTLEYEILDEGNYASVLDNAYLKLSGGTLTDSVMVNHSSGSKGYLLLTNGASIGGLVTNGTAVELFNVNGYGIGVEGTSDVYVLTNWAKKTMLHAGNIRDYAFSPQTQITNNTDADTLLTNGVYLNATGNGSGNSNFPSEYSILMTFTQEKNYSAQISVEKGSMHVRRKIDAWSDWKQIAFTDSNVASATKLQTARTIWGQSFDGTADVTGNLKLMNEVAIEAALKSGVSTSILHMSSSNNLVVGYGSSGLGISTYIDGNSVGLCYSTSRTLGFALNSSGNVTIGDKDYAGTDYKFFVHGEGRVSGGLSCIGLCGTRPTLGSAPSSGFIVDAYGKDTYGLSVWLENSGQSFVQSGRFDGDATAYALNLQPLGGDVNVGANLKVGGKMAVGGATDDGVTALQISGDGSTGHGIKILNGWSSASFGSYRSGYYARTGGWANGFYQYSSSGDILGGLEFAGRNEDLHLIRFLHGANAILELSNYEATINGDLKVTGNIIADGQVSSGGVAEAGTGGAVGGSGLDRVPFTIPVNTTSFTCEHNLGTREISVSIYEDGNDYQQILTDVYLDSDNTARIVFGSATDVVHKVVIIG